MTIQELMLIAHEQGASDLHLAVDAAPTLRLRGKLQPIGQEVLTAEQTLEMAKSILDSAQYREFEEQGELDCSYELADVSIFRVSVYQQKGNVSLTLRLIPKDIPNLETIGLPPITRQFVKQSRGLVLVTGPTGSGKSTTLAAMIDYINRHDQKHIITLEDPIEFIHPHQQSIVNQREIRVDTRSFATGLRAALRQDPDVILVGEMRDLETISTAVTAAETGHLVFGTLHTSDAPQTIDRIIDVFPPNQQQQIRMQLAGVLVGIIAQQLLPTSDGKGRIAAIEVLVNTPAVANLIRSEKAHQIRSVMQTGKAQGMVTMEMAIRDLLQVGKITKEAAQIAAQGHLERQ